MTTPKNEDAACPFCGGPVDPTGVLRGDGSRGPECENCGATAPTMRIWNMAKRAYNHHGAPVSWVTVYSQPGRPDKVETGPQDLRRDATARDWGWSVSRVPLCFYPAPPAASAEREVCAECGKSSTPSLD